MWLLQVFLIIFPQACLVCASLDYVLFAGMTTAFFCLFECFSPPLLEACVGEACWLWLVVLALFLLVLGCCRSGHMLEMDQGAKTLKL